MTTPIAKLLDTLEWTAIPSGDPGHDILPFATHRGVLRIESLEIRVFQLSNGARIFDAEDLAKFFEYFAAKEKP